MPPVAADELEPRWFPVVPAVAPMPAAAPVSTAVPIIPPLPASLGRSHRHWLHEPSVGEVASCSQYFMPSCRRPQLQLAELATGMHAGLPDAGADAPASSISGFCVVPAVAAPKLEVVARSS